eukprot:CAMPEP_0185910820 /NCGR_PEP_ID=MMETSP0196C-20130402/21959_1 /TAXON_ID=2932 /ORGANISM="Alexandrium fundyense, Strain CCMP1719" /LENGTH=48 /DNA_ID= /DNA_START= /DNA_END= /DNA_ORIENTATION=
MPDCSFLLSPPADMILAPVKMPAQSTPTIMSASSTSLQGFPGYRPKFA